MKAREYVYTTSNVCISTAVLERLTNSKPKLQKSSIQLFEDMEATLPATVIK